MTPSNTLWMTPVLSVTRKRCAHRQRQSPFALKSVPRQQGNARRSGHPDGQDHRSRPSTQDYGARRGDLNTLIASLCNGITSEQDCRALWLGAYRSLVFARAWTPCSSTKAHLYQHGRNPLWRADRYGSRKLSPQSTRLYTLRHRPYRRERHCAPHGPNSCSTTASTRPAWPTAGPTKRHMEPGSEQRRCFVSAMRETLAVANAEGALS